ncbi:MAG: patatin [Terriglobia bacterium]|nr:MAG: patatin [Terriglobia bacterium]
MKPRGILYWLLLAIGIATAFSGAVQLVHPSFVLGIVSAEATPASQHFFGIVGMFMLLFGGLLTHALLDGRDPGMVLLWTGLQKLGAAAAVGLGVMHHIFSGTALLIAGFDLLSGILIFVYRMSLASESSAQWTASGR